MSDTTEIVAVGGGGLSMAAIIWAALKWSGNRNISTLDDSLKELTRSISELNDRLAATHTTAIRTEATVAGMKELHDREMETFRAAIAVYDQRLEGLAKYWREAFDDVRKQFHLRMEKATADMVAAVNAAAAEAARGRKR